MSASHWPLWAAGSTLGCRFRMEDGGDWALHTDQGGPEWHSSVGPGPRGPPSQAPHRPGPPRAGLLLGRGRQDGLVVVVLLLLLVEDLQLQEELLLL